MASFKYFPLDKQQNLLKDLSVGFPHKKICGVDRNFSKITAASCNDKNFLNHHIVLFPVTFHKRDACFVSLERSHIFFVLKQNAYLLLIIARNISAFVL